MEEQLARFFEVAAADEIPYLAHAAKKTKYEDRQTGISGRIHVAPRETLRSSFIASHSSSDRGQSPLSRRDSARSASSLPPV